MARRPLQQILQLLAYGRFASHDFQYFLLIYNIIAATQGAWFESLVPRGQSKQQLLTQHGTKTDLGARVAGTDAEEGN